MVELHWIAFRQRRRVAVLATVTALAAIGCSTPSDELAKQSTSKVAMCSACHGPDGTSKSARSPLLAGQSADYLEAQLKAFREQSRADRDARSYMWPMAASLDDGAIARLAKHFSSLPVPPAEAGGEADAAGKAIFEAGIAAEGIPPCSSCHGDKGQGLAVFPRLAGQHADYLARQLGAYADGSRENPIMGPLAKKLSRPNIEAVSAYLATL
jgi:cytochrome c553